MNNLSKIEAISIDTIVVPQGAEYQAVCRGIAQAGSKIPVVAIPLGTKNIAITLQNLGIALDNICNLLIVGMCGSLDVNYSPGDAVVYQSCWDLDGQQVNLESALTTAIESKLALDLVAGITSDRIINRTAEKLALAQTYPVSVIDMEGYNCVQQLQKKKITVAILRVVSDDLSGDIPDLSRAFERNGNLKPLAMASAFLRQPIAALRLIKGSLTGLKVLEEIVYRLTKSPLDFTPKFGSSFGEGIGFNK